MKTRTARTAAVSMTAMFAMVAAGQPQTASACEECQLRKAGTYLGQFTLMGNGTVRTWVKLGQNGKPSAIGVTFSETALIGLPATAPKDMLGVEHNLALPKEAAVTGFDHIGLDWNPKGHEPPGIYDSPHFDLHFHLTPKEELKKITLQGAGLAKLRKKPQAQFIPAGYIMPPGTEVPGMGAHAIDAAAPELNGQPFTYTFLYGYHDGKVHFIEPMITKAFLETKPNLTIPLKQPAAYQKRGYYPTSYSIKHDPIRQEYTVALEGLTLRAGQSQGTIVAAKPQTPKRQTVAVAAQR